MSRGAVFAFAAVHRQSCQVKENGKDADVELDVSGEGDERDQGRRHEDPARRQVAGVYYGVLPHSA